MNKHKLLRLSRNIIKSKEIIMNKLSQYRKYCNTIIHPFIDYMLMFNRLFLHKSFITAVICFLFTQTTWGQNFLQEKRIYVVDVTASMEGKGVV